MLQCTYRVLFENKEQRADAIVFTDHVQASITYEPRLSQK